MVKKHDYVVDREAIIAQKEAQLQHEQNKKQYEQNEKEAMLQERAIEIAKKEAVLQAEAKTYARLQEDHTLVTSDLLSREGCVIYRDAAVQCDTVIPRHRDTPLGCTFESKNISSRPRSKL